MPEKKTRGEIWYDRLVYQGVNYWLNLGVSLIAADYFTNLAGRKHLDKLITVTEKALLKSGLAKGGAHKSAKVAWETLALTGGGWMAAFATKPLEDHKRPIVHWLNDQLGENQLKPDGTKATADEIYIEKEQPHQSWFNIIKRRVYASIAVVAVGHAIEYTVGKKQVTDVVVTRAEKALRSGYIPGGKALADNPATHRYLHFAVLDTLFTAVHAVTMKLTTGAKRAHMPKEASKDCDPAGKQVKPNEIATAPAPEAETKLADKYKKPKIEKQAKSEKQESFAKQVRATETDFSIAT